MHFSRSHRPARIRRGVLGIVTAIILTFPVGVLAAGGYDDVRPGHLFYADVQAIHDAGVTTGCGGGNYCPNAYVTRGQMAAFLNRLGALGPGKTPVANADRVDGAHAVDMALAGLRVRGTTAEVVQWYNHAGGEPTVIKTGTGVFAVTIPGRSLNHSTNFVGTATVVGAPGFATVSSSTGTVIVNTYDETGAASDESFMLMLVDASSGG